MTNANEGLYNSPLKEADQLRIRIFELFLLISIVGSAFFVLSYIWGHKYHLIPLMVFPFLIPSAILLFISKKNKSYKVNLIGVYYYFTVMGVLKLYSSPDYLVDLFVIPVFIGFAYLTLHKRDAVLSVIFITSLYLIAATTVHYYKPFDIIYTNENTPSVYVGYIVSFFALNIVFYAFANLYNKLLIKLSNALNSLKEINNNNLLMINVVTHDISNYLTATNLTIYRLKQLSTDSTTNEAIKRIELAMNNLNELIHSVRLVRDLTHNDKENHLREISITDIFTKLELIFLHKLKEKDLHFEKNLGLESANILVEPDILIHNILGNILTNAIKFSPQGSKIKFEFINENESYSFKISNCCGRQHLNNLKNIQADLQIETQTGTNNEIGQGLGLSIVKNFCSMFEMFYSLKVEENETLYLNVINAIKIPKNNVTGLPTKNFVLTNTTEAIS